MNVTVTTTLEQDLSRLHRFIMTQWKLYDWLESRSILYSTKIFPCVFYKILLNWIYLKDFWLNVHVICFFLLSGFSFTNIHDSQDSIGRRKGVISSTLLCHFNPLHRYLAISQAITAENSLLRISSSRNRSGTFGFQDQVPNH